MPSPTSTLMTIRTRKIRTRGKKRKNALARHGSTKSAKELFAKK